MTTSIRNGGSAFPVMDADMTGLHCRETGMTLRDYFAAKAMAALVLSGTIIKRHTAEGTLEIPARIALPPLAYEYADAMLAAREVQP